MQRFTIILLLAGLALAFFGCGGEGEEANGDGTEADGPKVYPTAETLVDAFIKAANSQNKEAFYALFYSDDAANAVWERVTESGLTFSPGYHIEDSSFGKHVIFDSARWEGYGTYEQQLYISDDPAMSKGWIINGQDYAFVEEETEPAEDTVEETGETAVEPGA
ncbi:MAG: hypothetical protein A2Y64_02240 [Candidatus Coatesbacteria bacterium RBG_13_66_14]|uniref:Uncharacterized protein n=1 Tax=Candidatus Coatesbacteria bacterium RBG_13_66_14 TaxID=1817816 RepID=A0A1F5EVZ8_9BACT|nr:MAG: hypothetical protein A2Y64_02240 [Candidatus Coatesbacteria bacterium RBG_13_66_14]